MRVLVIGGAGFVGSHIVTALLAKGHDVTLGGRGFFCPRFPSLKSIPVDYKTDTNPEVWKPRLNNIDAVVNCIGVLNAKNGEIDCIHHKTPAALFTACQQKGTKHVVQISAKGTEVDRGIAYNDTKKAADDFLKNLNISATIIRPSYVYSHGSYGGSSLFRGLAAMPFFLPVVGKGDQLFQPILAEDLAAMIVNRIETAEPGMVELDGIGPEKVSNLQLLEKTRTWLGFGKGIILRAPMSILNVVSLISCIAPAFPINRTTVGMMKFPDVAASTPEAFEKLVETTGVKPKGYSEILREQPSFVQDRWHARLFLLKPLIRIILALMWIVSGLVSFWIPEGMQQALMHLLPFTNSQFVLLMHCGTGLDILLGILILFNWRPMWIGLLQLVVIICYTAFISIWLPTFWLHPFGPLVKNVPILVLVLVSMAIASDR